MLKAPFPWFGGKSRVAHLVWERFGVVKNYVEPFFGSGAVLLGRPDWVPGMVETVNDKDSLLTNFWRAVTADPDAVAEHAHWPVIESDLHARNYYLLTQRETLRARLEGDPEFYDAKLAGWWVWGIGLWIGGGFATHCGPWASVDGLFVNTGKASGGGITRQVPYLKSQGCGVHQEVLPAHAGVKRQLPATAGGGTGGHGRGIHAVQISGQQRCGRQRQTPACSSSGQGVHREPRLEDLKAWFQTLSHRLARVRVCCGDWKRVLGPSVTTNYGMTAVPLDAPYKEDDCDDRCYAHEVDGIWMETHAWALANGSNPLLRIALCGYEGPHGAELVAAGWDEVSWKARGYGGGMGKRGEENRHRERIWFSPHCLKPSNAEQLDLLGGTL